LGRRNKNRFVIGVTACPDEWGLVFSPVKLRLRERELHDNSKKSHDPAVAQADSALSQIRHASGEHPLPL
jgi:hypothetical protein